MGGRLGGVFGWAGLAVLVGGGVLALEPLAGLSSNSPRSTELTWPLGAAVLIALLTVFALLLSAANPEARPEERPQRGQFLFRVFVAAVGLFLAWLVLPTRHLDSEVRHAAGGVPPEVVVELLVAVCLVALGLVLLLGASSALQIRRWSGALLGVGAGALVVVLVMALTPALSRLLLVEHTVTGAGREPAPVPADVTRVGWTWQPEQPVVDMGRGPQGPIVRYEDGFVALDTATGEELWRQEWAPRQPMTVNAPGVRQGRAWLGGEAVVVTGHGLHGLETGEPVEARGEGAEDAASRSGEVLAADTGGTVVLRDADEEERTALVLETDAGGEVTRETEVAAPGSYFQLSGALPLAEALVSTRAVRHPPAEARSERALLVVPPGGEVEEEDLRWIRFDGEEVPETDGVEHRALAVPGAVVSYVHDPDNTADRPFAVHGLVP